MTTHRATKAPSRSITAMAIVVVGAAAMLLPPRADAHHAFAAEFDSNQPVELKGVVSRIQWTNPHSWIYVDVKDTRGNVTTWAIEFGSPYGLLQKGLRKTSFPIGIEVTVKGFRAKSGKAVANGTTVTLADGQGFYTGASDSPDAAPETR
jgi:hypothetical protein